MTRLISILLLVVTVPVYGATYFIDYATGNDANNGTSKATPFKRHPYMAGFAGAYVHAAGDRFIFKGGVTWPNACFTMNVLAGGSGIGTQDYYGVDQTWYTGGSWTRPIFDAGGIELAGGYDVMILCNLATPPHYITFDSLDIRNVYWTGPKSFSQVAYFNLSVSHDITITNCWMHNWTHGTLGAGTTDIMKVVVGSNSNPWNPGCLITGCLIDGENAANSSNGTSSGEGTYAYSGDVVNTTVRNCASGFIVTGDPANHTTPQIVRGCDIGPSFVSFDAGEHPDGLFMNGGNLFHWHNNFIHDCNVEIVFAGNGSGDEDTYIWNNVIWNGTTHTPIEIDTPYSGGRVYLYNNTLIGGPYSGVRVVGRPFPGGTLGVLDMRNNFVISDGGIFSIDGIADVTNLTNQNNVLLDTATASVSGWSAANRYAPQSPNQPTYDAGQDLSGLLSGAISPDILGVTRPQGAAWDVGAYEFSSPGAGVLAFSTDAQATSPGAGMVGVTVVRNGGTTGSVGITAYTADGTAVDGHDYTAVVQSLTWPDGDNGARNFLVPILNSGDTGINSNRFFTVNFINPTGGATVGSPSVETVTIDLPPPPPPSSTNGGVFTDLSVTVTVALDDGFAGVGVTRSGSTNIGASMDYYTVDGTAKAGTDYTTTTGTLTWGVNENTTKVILVPIINTGKSGAPIWFNLVLTNPTNGASIAAPNTSTISILLIPPISAPNGIKLVGSVKVNGQVKIAFNP